MTHLDTSVEIVPAAEFLPDDPESLQRTDSLITDTMLREGAFEMIMDRFGGTRSMRRLFNDTRSHGVLNIHPLLEVDANGSRYPDGILRLFMGRYTPKNHLGAAGLVTTIGRRINGSSAWLEPLPDVPVGLAWRANGYLRLSRPVA